MRKLGSWAFLAQNVVTQVCMKENFQDPDKPLELHGGHLVVYL